MTREELVNASNIYHEALLEYIEKNGMDETVILEMEVKIKWLKMVAEKHGITLREDFF